jgi:hypothetical protein
MANLVLPMSLAILFAPGLFSQVLFKNPAAVAIVVGCGASWGVGAFLWAVSFSRLGYALSASLVNGTVVLVGSLSPLIIGAARIPAGQGGRLALGLSLVVGAISLCTWASVMRDHDAGTPAGAKATVGGSLAAIAVAVLSGLFSSTINAGFAFGGGLIAKATAAGIPAAPASLAVWVPVFCGGFVVNMTGCIWKIGRDGNWNNFRKAPRTDWLRAISLGFLWLGGFLTYGVCSRLLGEAGTVYGFAVFIGTALLTSTSWGIGTGEWRKARLKARLCLIAGVALFLTALAVLAFKK